MILLDLSKEYNKENEEEKENESSVCNEEHDNTIYHSF